jgi:hypothetical protein
VAAVAAAFAAADIVAAAVVGLAALAIDLVTTADKSAEATPGIIVAIADFGAAVGITVGVVAFALAGRSTAADGPGCTAESCGDGVGISLATRCPRTQCGSEAARDAAERRQGASLKDFRTVPTGCGTVAEGLAFASTGIFFAAGRCS